MIFADETEEGAAVTGLPWLTRPDQANYLPWNNNSWRETETGSIKPLEREIIPRVSFAFLVNLWTLISLFDKICCHYYWDKSQSGVPSSPIN